MWTRSKEALEVPKAECHPDSQRLPRERGRFSVAARLYDPLSGDAGAAGEQVVPTGTFGQMWGTAADRRQIRWGYESVFELEEIIFEAVKCFFRCGACDRRTTDQG